MKVELITSQESKDLLNSLKLDSSKYKGIICPLRGGMYIADPLSRKYNLPLYYINIKSYEGIEQKQLRVLSRDDIEVGHYLIADDIYDSGNTIEFIKKLYNHCTFDAYCLITKNKDVNILYGKYVDKDKWVTYWWENLLNKEDKK